MPSSARPGCLLFAIPRMLLGGGAAGALPDGLALPDLDTATVHPSDLPAMIKVRNAARQCHALLEKANLGDGATRDAGRELVGWVIRIYAIGPRLKQARGFLVRHATDTVALERAELELELVGSSPERIRELKAAMKALDERARHSKTVAAEVDRLSARLISAAAELEALHARLGSALGSDDLVHEMRAWHKATELALDAFAKTVGEIG